MAKFGLMFLVLFVAVQLSLAASRFPRDAPAEAAAATEDPMKALNALFESAKTQISGLLTKENIDAAVAGVTKFGEQVRTAGSDALKTLQSTADNLAATTKD